MSIIIQSISVRSGCDVCICAVVALLMEVVINRFLCVVICTLWPKRAPLFVLRGVRLMHGEFTVCHTCALLEKILSLT